MFPLLTCHQNIDIWSLKLNLQVKICVNIWYINYSLAQLIGRSQNGVLETVAQFSCPWVANTFWGLETSLRSQGYDPSYFCWKPKSFGDKILPVQKLGSKWKPHTNVAAHCVYVCRSHQTSNKQMTNKQQVCKAKISFNDKINAKQSHELKCELYMLKKFCKWP